MPRDHGGGVDAAIARFGGTRGGWLDLSTGINPQPYPVQDLPAEVWTGLPDQTAHQRICNAARDFWQVPQGAAVLPAPGASALIARIPALTAPGNAIIPGPTYNEHAAAFAQAGWQITAEGAADVKVVVHPNNPDGRLWPSASLAGTRITVIDESFCDICPDKSLIHLAQRPGVIVLKSFGKFWGLAGLRLGFAIGDRDLLARLARMLGPWPVAGPALEIGRRALFDQTWAAGARNRLASDAARMDVLLKAGGGDIVGGTTLFRLAAFADAPGVHRRLARVHILSRIFPYSRQWVRFGLPPNEDGWHRLEAAL